MIGCGIARLDFQGPGVVRHCGIIAAQAVIGEGAVVEGPAVARVQLDGSAVVPQGFLKPPLHSMPCSLETLLLPSLLVTKQEDQQ